MPLDPGTTLGSYEIVDAIGAGGMGEVYRARDTKLDRMVAIKVLPETVAQNADALARFQREAKAVAALSHPNILAIHDLGEHEGHRFAVMELLEGETLRERLRGGPLPARKAAELARQVARGLAAAHDKGIVHRDLKPENLFVTTEGRVKILDFGLARTTETIPEGDADATRTSVTTPGVVMGTVGYMSPEQASGNVADNRADIFSLGTILYEMLSGRRAFQRETGAETMTAILRGGPARSDRGFARRAAAAGASRPALPGEAAGRALPVGAGSFVCDRQRGRDDHDLGAVAPGRPAGCTGEAAEADHGGAVAARGGPARGLGPRYGAEHDRNIGAGAGSHADLLGARSCPCHRARRQHDRLHFRTGRNAAHLAQADLHRR